jgi:hypothetical protein
MVDAARKRAAIAMIAAFRIAEIRMRYWLSR